MREMKWSLQKRSGSNEGDEVVLQENSGGSEGDEVVLE